MRVSTLTTVVLVLAATHLHAQDTTYIQWDPPQALTTDTNYFYAVPRVQVEGNNVYMVWVISPGGIPLFMHSTNNGETWSEPFPLADTTLRLIGGSQYTVGAGNVNYLSDWQDLGPPIRYWLWQRRSRDAGATWNSGETLFEGVYSVPTAITGYDHYRSLAYGLYPQTTVTPLFATSLDTGAVWTPFPQSLPSGWGPGGMALRPPYFYLAREGAANGRAEVTFTLSTDFGATWRPEAFISSTDTIVSDLPHLAADGEGNVYAVWRDGKYGCPNGFGCTIMFRRSTNYGISWLDERTLTSRPEGTFPRVAVSGNIVAAVWYTDVGSVSGDTFLVRCRVSINGGAAFLPVVTVNTISIYAIDPDVGVMGNFIHVVWAQKPYPNARWSNLYYRRGNIVTTGIAGNELSFPKEPELLIGYPNPFNAQTTIEFDLPHRMKTQLVVINILGQVVTIILDEEYDGGKHRIHWNGTDRNGRMLASGVYIIQLRTSYGFSTQKILLLR
jgi:hypothetical protein